MTTKALIELGCEQGSEYCGDCDLRKYPPGSFYCKCPFDADEWPPNGKRLPECLQAEKEAQQSNV